MAPPPLLALAASMVALAFAYFTSVATPATRTTADRDHQDQAKALRMTADWLGTYPDRLWIGVALPEPCVAQNDGSRSCPISISFRAWSHGALAPFRCDARVVLPSPGEDRPARRTSARCHELEAFSGGTPAR
jgi:hypothetical protein